MSKPIEPPLHSTAHLGEHRGPPGDTLPGLFLLKPRQKHLILSTFGEI